jgi:hypothetical protein
MRRHESRDAAYVDLGSVLRGKRSHPVRIELTTRGQIRHLVEELLEAGRRDDFKDAGRNIACIPKRVPLTARLEDQVANFAIDDLAAEVSPHSTLEDKAVLILTTVAVHRSSQRMRFHRVFNQGESASGLSSINHEANADPA